MDEKKRFSIGEFSEKTGISITNLRYYDEIGLLVPEKHPTSGHRIYSYEDIITLQKILSLKFLGCSLEQVKDLLHEPSFTVDLNETLSLHLDALEEEKKNIERSMHAIRRVITLLNQEREVDSGLLFSLICSLPTEHMHKRWMERHELSDVVESIAGKSEEEKMALDQSFLEITKRAKQLCGTPVEDKEVKELVEEYMEAACAFLGEEVVQKLANADVEETELKEFENMTPSPFTEEEQAWLIRAMDFHMDPVKET